MGGGDKIPYPKHVWSPAGGWYSQPANWRTNTAIMGAVVIGITAMAWNYSANHEQREHYPELGRFYPSRWWSKDVIANDKKLREQQKQQQQS